MLITVTDEGVRVGGIQGNDELQCLKRREYNVYHE